MKTIITTAFAMGFIYFSAFVQNDSRADTIESSVSTGPFSVRIRPMALVYGIPGAEFYYETRSGYFIGVTAQFFDAENDDKGTALTNNEYGIKFGKFFGEGYGASGFFIQGNVNFNHSEVSTHYPPTGQTLSATFNQFSEVLTAGYQFRMTFVNPDRLNTRLGVGLDYKPSSGTDHEIAADGASIPLNVREHLDPMIELTVGYLL